MNKDKSVKKIFPKGYGILLIGLALNVINLSSINEDRFPKLHIILMIISIPVMLVGVYMTMKNLSRK